MYIHSEQRLVPAFMIINKKFIVFFIFIYTDLHGIKKQLFELFKNIYSIDIPYLFHVALGHNEAWAGLVSKL